jgi:hypothetical protein
MGAMSPDFEAQPASATAKSNNIARMTSPQTFFLASIRPLFSLRPNGYIQLAARQLAVACQKLALTGQPKSSGVRKASAPKLGAI